MGSVEKQLAEQGALTMHSGSLFTGGGTRRSLSLGAHCDDNECVAPEGSAGAFYCRKAVF